MTATTIKGATVEEVEWPQPDPGVLNVYRREPPAFPLAVLGEAWGMWVGDAAEASACPVDYVALPLLSSASALIGHARWAEAAPGWAEPPVLWTGTVGDSGVGKTHAAACVLNQVLPPLERRMRADYADRFTEWAVDYDLAKAKTAAWQAAARKAEKKGETPPEHPPLYDIEEPQEPCLRQTDFSVEKLALLLASSAPKGLLLVRNELAGLIFGVNTTTRPAANSCSKAMTGSLIGLCA
jgi:hypothetical protein